MMFKHFQFSTKSLLVGVFFVAYILAAYGRGNYLLGAGIMYAIIAALIALLFLRTLLQSPLPKFRFAFLVLFATLVSLAFAFPMYLNPDVQYFVNDRATERNARNELAMVFAGDAAFRDLAVSTTRRKIVNVEIRGTVPTTSALNRLQSHLNERCQFMDDCLVHWEVEVRDKSR